MTDPPFTLRTITATARLDVLGQQLEAAEREVVASQYRLESAVTEQETKVFTKQNGDAIARAQNLQKAMDEVQAEVAVVPPAEDPGVAATGEDVSTSEADPDAAE